MLRNKYRLAFKKTGPVCFLGHLDLQSVFHRALKRSKLPVSYSKGFNPHQQLSFALPLPLGMEGLHEYADIELDIITDPAKIIDKLNGALPDGIIIKTAGPMNEGEKSSAALVERADYDVVLPHTKVLENKLDEAINQIMTGETLTIMKKTKSGMKECDIRADIFDLRNKSRSDERNIVLGMTLSAGSMKNLKPDVVVECVYNNAGVSYDPFEVKYTRTQLSLKD